MKILHIEDRRENRLLVRKLLEARGFSVVDASDGLSGIELAHAEAPALILLDINIPGLDGYEVVTKLKGDSATAAIPVVAITAEGDRDRALALGFDGFIVKPIRIATFVGELQAFLDGKREALERGDRAEHLMAHNRQVVDHLEAKVRELTRANERLLEVDRLKMEVLRNVSHELSTPMTPLLGYVSMLSGGELGPLNDGQLKILSRMSGSLGRLKGLIDNLLNVTRFATGAVSLSRTLVAPSAVVRAALDQRREACVAAQVEPEVRLLTEERLYGDEGRLVAALAQLIDNALKFGPVGGPLTVEARLVVQAGGDRRIIEFAVDDAGPGIPPERRRQVIQPFFQIDGSATRAYGGAGLVLAIAERTAALHGGSLLISGSSHGGARVALRIPTRPAD